MKFRASCSESELGPQISLPELLTVVFSYTLIGVGDVNVGHVIIKSEKVKGQTQTEYTTLTPSSSSKCCEALFWQSLRPKLMPNIPVLRSYLGGQEVGVGACCLGNTGLLYTFARLLLFCRGISSFTVWWGKMREASSVGL